jgi:hypothetical protein
MTEGKRYEVALNDGAGDTAQVVVLCRCGDRVTAIYYSGRSFRPNGQRRLRPGGAAEKPQRGSNSGDSEIS